MKRQLFTLSIVGVFSLNTFASFPPGNDVTTKPDLYYLTNDNAIDSLALLPPPPQIGSIAFLNDQAMYENEILKEGSWQLRMPISVVVAWQMYFLLLLVLR